MLELNRSETIATPGRDAAAARTASVARTAVGAELPCREVAVDGVQLAYDDEGSGPAVICLHAIGHGAGDFRVLRRRLAGSYRVIALDWPGQGRSGEDHRPPSAGRYADLLAGLVETLGVERVVLIGNSIGGAAALRYAAIHPQRVRGLILENPGGLDRPDHLARTVIGAMVRFFSAGADRAWWYPAAFALYYRMVLPSRPAAAQRTRIVASAFEIAPLLRDAWRGFAEPSADLRALSETVQCPILFAWATRDRFVQLRRSLPTIRRFANARLERFRAGHAAHLETPDGFETSTERFLAALA
jgi:4,5:9,10-diseco-3-hydroxy-5,9,17-trioxoandrosta-1(10),2-diene-4-oate hydrolase